MFRGLLPLLAIVATTYGSELVPTTSSPEGRIVGGQNAQIEDFPYQVAITRNGYFYCGGSILAARVVISAAHRFSVPTPQIFALQYGSAHMYEGKTIKIKSIIIHENYNNANYDNDIAILHLAEDIEFGPNAQPIALASTLPAPGWKAIVLGWGYLDAYGPLSNVLQKVQLVMRTHTSCFKDFQDLGLLVTDSMICAGFRGNGKSGCYGDAGGPLVINNELVGIISWGNNLCNYPTVFTNVVYLRSWIDLHSKIQNP